MFAAKIKALVLNGVMWAVIALLLWWWTERRVEDTRLLAWSECRRQGAEQAQKDTFLKNKRIRKNAEQKLEILSFSDMGFDTLLELMRSGKL